MVHELFDITMRRYGIQAKALSGLSGVSQNHISEFRSGKLKTGVTTDCLWRLLAGMDELAPGSQRYFCDLLGGKKKPSQGFADDLEFLIESADEQELEKAFQLIGQRMFSKSTDVLRDKERINSYVIS